MKHVILHADGMADHPRKELGGRTPLQAASTPYLDRLAQGGELGLLAAAPENMRQGNGLMGTALLGYDPKNTIRVPVRSKPPVWGWPSVSMMWSIAVRWSRFGRMLNLEVKAA
jgi:hypothetical protein